MWNQIGVDEELGLAYLPVETPSSDFYGGLRPGNNLFAESLVAIDYKTGKRKWHFQLVHHPIWNMDIATAPMLVDLTVNGRPVKAVARDGQAGVSVSLRSRDRRADLADRRAARAASPTCPARSTSPTQPFPTKPPAYDHQGVTIENLIDFTPELHAEALKIAARYKLGPIFTPPPVSKTRRADRQLPIVGRHELAGRLVRSGDAHRLRAVVHARCRCSACCRRRTRSSRICRTCPATR